MTFVVDGTNGLTFNDATTQSSTATNASNISSGTLGKARLPTGSVLQVVQGTTSTNVTTSTTATTDTGLTATITPTSSTSKILVIVSQNFLVSGGGTNSGSIYLVRNSTQINTSGTYPIWTTTGTEIGLVFNITLLDSPATTSATVYKTQQKLRDGGSMVTQRDSLTASTITLLEISA
jgi:hypothetical protein